MAVNRIARPISTFLSAFFSEVIVPSQPTLKSSLESPPSHVQHPVYLLNPVPLPQAQSHYQKHHNCRYDEPGMVHQYVQPLVQTQESRGIFIYCRVTHGNELGAGDSFGKAVQGVSISISLCLSAYLPICPCACLCVCLRSYVPGLAICWFMNCRVSVLDWRA